MQLPPSLLLQLVTDGCLLFTEDGFLIESSRQETEILFAVLRYFEQNPNFVHCLTKLLSDAIHLLLVPHRELESLKNNPLVASSSANMELVKKALNWPDKSTPESWAAHRVLIGLCT